MDVIADERRAVTDTLASPKMTAALENTPRRERRRASRPAGPPGADTRTPDAFEVVVPRASEPLARRLFGRNNRVRIATIAVVLAVVGVLVAVTINAALDHRTLNAQRDHRAAVIAAARQGVLDLINISHDSADKDLARLVSVSTTPFVDEVTGQQAGYLQSIRDQAVSSAGNIDAIGFESESGDTATVVVAASAKVSNLQTSDQEQRQYRFTVTIKRVGGALKMSTVEFVP